MGGGCAPLIGAADPSRWLEAGRPGLEAVEGGSVDCGLVECGRDDGGRAASGWLLGGRAAAPRFVLGRDAVSDSSAIASFTWPSSSESICVRSSSAAIRSPLACVCFSRFAAVSEAAIELWEDAGVKLNAFKSRTQNYAQDAPVLVFYTYDRLTEVFRTHTIPPIRRLSPRDTTYVLNPRRLLNQAHFQRTPYP